MDTERGAFHPDDVTRLPSALLDAAAIDHLELVLGGAYVPGPRYLNAAERESVRARGALPDGTAWELPLALRLQQPTSVQVGDYLVLRDSEAVPLAVLTVTEVAVDRDGRTILAGPLRALRSRTRGSFAGLRETAAEAADRAPHALLVVATDRPLHTHDLGAVSALASEQGAGVLLLGLTGTGRGAAEPLARALLAAVNQLADLRAHVRLVQLPALPELSPVREARLLVRIAAAYGGDLALLPDGVALRSEENLGPGLPVPVHIGPPGSLDQAAVEVLLDHGRALPRGFTSALVERELRAIRPALHQRGVVLFFTGLSGSGKSTVAAAVVAALSERTSRRVTLLDGDVVRTMLSAGLTFSKEHRELNVRRIGYVAAEIGRHGGTVVCSPIAPYAHSRAEVRHMVELAGAHFVLIHVATPLQVCEARDRKGLYARARAGEIPAFTGISDPYEIPDDADLRLDTSVISVGDCVEQVLALLNEAGVIEAAVARWPR